MKLNTVKTFLFASVITVSGAVLPASAAERIQVSVPFSFLVGGVKMAPGDYSVTESDNGMVTLLGSKTSAMILSVPADFSKDNATALNFTSSDSNQILTGIQVSGSISREIPFHGNVEHKSVLANAR